MKYLLLLLPVLLCAQVTVKVTGTTATQAVLQIRGHGGNACTLNLRAGSASGDLHPDVTASTDTGRSDTMAWADGTRQVVLGHQYSNLALSADTRYHLTVSGCASQTLVFQTKTAQLGATMPYPFAADSSSFHNASFPEIDWSPSTGQNKWYTDPVTGVRQRLVIRPGDFTWADNSDRTPAYWAGGASWTNPGTVVNGDTSTAQTTNTNPVYVYPNMSGQQQWDGVTQTIGNIGVIVWAQAVSCTTADCDVQIGVFTHPDEGFAGTPITLRASSAGSMAKIAGGSSHTRANGAYPTAYPDALWAGWGDVTITKDMQIGSVSDTGGFAAMGGIASGVITLLNPSMLNIDSNTTPGHVPRTLRSGHHIWVSTSGCTANGMTDICTVDTNTNTASLTLEETSVSEAAGTLALPLPWGIRIQKVTGTGTVKIGVKYRFSGIPSGTTGTYNPECGPVEVTDADGVKGHPCAVPIRGSYLLLYFISNDGEVVRPISYLYLNDGAVPIDGPLEEISFSPTDGDVFYVRGGAHVLRGEYSGDWKTSAWDSSTGRHVINSDATFAYPGFNSPNGDYITYTKVLTNAATQVAAQYPSQVASPYASWSGNLVGISGDLAIQSRTVSGQDAGPCQIAVFNLIADTLIDFINTMDHGGAMGWGSCHAVTINAAAGNSVPNTFQTSMNFFGQFNGYAGDSTKLSAGPYEVPVEAIMSPTDTWSTSIVLPWPPNSATYKTACPGGLSAEYTDFGAAGNECVTLKTSGEPCNIAPNGSAAGPTGDYLLFGTCSWNASFAKGSTLRPGNLFIDRYPSTNPGTGVDRDSEHFRVLTVEVLTGADAGKLKIVAQRNASRDYCCKPQSLPVGYECVCSDNQFAHLAPSTGSFSLIMAPGTKASCAGAEVFTTYTDPTNGASRVYTELSHAFQGHTGYGRGPGGTLRFLASGAITVPDITALGVQPPIFSSLKPINAKYDGVNAPIGTYLQLYYNHGQSAAPDVLTIASADANAVNPGAGIAGNHFGNGIAPCAGGSNCRNLTNITGSVWSVDKAVDEWDGMSITDYKRRGLFGFAGPKMLTDASSPSTGNTIDAAPDYSFCHAYKANECRTGSSVGGLYVKVPWAYKHHDASLAEACTTGMEFANVPCLYAGYPLGGYIRHFRSDRADTPGSDMHLVSSALRPPGTHYPYWGAVMHPSGKMMLFTTGGHLEGIQQNVLLAVLPGWQDYFPRRNTTLPAANSTNGGLKVRIGARTGVTHARVRFGYNSDFHCSGREEACVTDASISPYAFVSSDATLTATTCSSGCTIDVPAMPGRVLFYRIETYDSATWTNGDVQAAAI